MAMRSPGAELRKANSRRAYLRPFKSFSTSRVPLHVQPSPNRTPDKPKKDGFFSQLRRSVTSAHRASSSSPSATPAAIAGTAVPSKEGVHPPWGRRVKNGLSKPLKVVKTSYVDCMMGIAENPQVESLGFQQNSKAYAFQASASRHVQRSSSSASERDMVSPIDEQLHALLRHRKHHADIISTE